MKKIKNWLSSSTKNKVIFICGIVVLAAIICVASFFIYKKAIKHEHTVDYKYESLNDGTHKKTSYCTDEDGKECKDFHSETTTEECEFDEDGICKYCGYSKYVTVKFTNNVDSKVIKEEKYEKGYTLDPEKDFPEAEEIEGYEFVRYDGNFTSLKADTTITLLYNPIGEEKKEEASTGNNTNSNSKNNSNNTSANNNSSNNSGDNTTTETWNDGSGDEELPAEVLEQSRIRTERYNELISQACTAPFKLTDGYPIADCSVNREWGTDNTYLIISVTTPEGVTNTITLYPSK